MTDKYVIHFVREVSGVSQYVGKSPRLNDRGSIEASMTVDKAEPKLRRMFRLPGSKGNAMPKHIICLDTETVNRRDENDDGMFRQYLRLGHAVFMQMTNERLYKDRTWVYEETAFKTREEFYAWFEVMLEAVPEGEVIWVVAHNMAYDFAVLGLDRYLSSIGSITLVVPDQVFLFYVRTKTHDIHCISTTNWYRGTLADVAKIYGSFKMDTPDFNDVDDEYLSKYCRQDAWAVVEIMKGHIEFLLKNDLGEFKPTIAGQAYTAYRHRFKPDNLYVHHYQDIINLEMQSYRGGRCEPFFIGKCPEPIYVLDVHSMYPYVMSTEQYPIKPLTSHPMQDIDPYLLRTHYFIARCHMQIKRPFLGVKRVVDGEQQLIFPTGNIEAVVTKPEVEYLIRRASNGKLLSMRDVVLYETGPVFRDYIEYFYKMKKAAVPGSVEYTMSKLFLNGLYGRMAMRLYERPRFLDPDDPEDYKTIFLFESCPWVNRLFSDRDGLRVTYTRIGEQIIETCNQHGEDDLMHRYSIPAIPSAVTAYARIYLWKLIEMAGRENVYYCDTDSLFVNRRGYELLMANGMVHDSELGKLGVEGPYDMSIFGPKDYIKDGKEVIKGVKKNAIKLDEGVYQQEQFITGKARFNMGAIDCVPVRTVTRTCKRKYHKGVVKDDGRVVPFHLTDFCASTRPNGYGRDYRPPKPRGSAYPCP